ncbi:MAG: hypothetical protein L0154_19820 [Chloroflexi bacterium]|nr:hypothetical protein [Chloroflexota bacterium]
MFWWGRFFFPAIFVLIILEQFGISLWWLLGVFWLAPLILRGWCFPMMRGDELPQRKRKELASYDYEPARPIDGSRRIIRTSDGEILTAVEDPSTGMLILED